MKKTPWGRRLQTIGRGKLKEGDHQVTTYDTINEAEEI